MQVRERTRTHRRAGRRPKRSRAIDCVNAASHCAAVGCSLRIGRIPMLVRALPWSRRGGGHQGRYRMSIGTKTIGTLASCILAASMVTGCAPATDEEVGSDERIGEAVQ